LTKNIEEATIAIVELQIVACKQNTRKRNKNINKTIDIVKRIDNSFLLCNFVIVSNIKHIVFEINEIKLYQLLC